MDDDFNTGGALGELYELVRALNRYADTHEARSAADPERSTSSGPGSVVLKELTQILGLFRHPRAKPEAAQDKLTGAAARPARANSVHGFGRRKTSLWPTRSARARRPGRDPGRPPRRHELADRVSRLRIAELGDHWRARPRTETSMATIANRETSTATEPDPALPGRVVGIDPGLNVTGYAVVEPTGRGPYVVEAGVIRPRGSRRRRWAGGCS